MSYPSKEKAYLKFANNFKEWHSDFTLAVSNCLKELLEAENYNDLMNAKKRLLYTIVNELPMYSDHCIFCVERTNSGKDGDESINCKRCPYGKEFGICFPDEGKSSTWSTMEDQAEELKESIDRYYQDGKINGNLFGE
jgi:hypothetical protein